MRILVLLALLLGGVAVNAADHRVPDDFPTIEDAITHAAAGDTVTVAPGTYHEVMLPLRDRLTLRGASGNPDDVVVDGQGAGSMIYHTDPTTNVTISHLSFLNGVAAGGGAIRIQSADNLTISDCVFANNHAVLGGAIYFHSLKVSQQVIRDCRFHDNESEDTGGAVYAFASDFHISGCTFTGNSSAGDAGAVNGTTTLSDCRFIDNTAQGSGGAVWQGGQVSLCLFEGNTADLGGASAQPERSVDNTYTGNSARRGGAVYRSGFVEGCSFTANEASEFGGAVYMSITGVFSSEFERNRAPRGGAIADIEYAAGCTFVSNEATAEGGACYSRWVGYSHTISGSGFSGNAAPVGSDGSFPVCTRIRLECCRTDPTDWNAPEIIIDDSDCPTPNETVSFGRLKSIFR